MNILQEEIDSNDEPLIKKPCIETDEKVQEVETNSNLKPIGEIGYEIQSGMGDIKNTKEHGGPILEDIYRAR